MFNFKKINSQKLFLLCLLALSLGCASLGKKWKALVSDTPEQPQASDGRGPQSLASSQSPSFSSQPNFMAGKERKYKRVTKENFSDDQALEDNAGSLWRKEGQGSYLFSQNNLRVLGDIVNVSIEGKAAENVETKVAIVKQMLARIDAPFSAKTPRAPSAVGQIPKPESKNAPAQAPPTNTTPSNETTAENKTDSKDDKIKFDNIPCRIVEKNTDGSYRVKGQQTVYINRREYRLMVTGLIHPDDITVDAISSSKLIDSKYDLVSSNKDMRNDIVR